MNRFELVSEDEINTSDMNNMQWLIVRDKITGVLYLHTKWSGIGSITPLIDKDGKPANK